MLLTTLAYWSKVGKLVKIFIFFLKTAFSCLTLITEKQVKPSFALLAPTSVDLQYSPHIKNDTDVENVTEAPFQSLTGIDCVLKYHHNLKNQYYIISQNVLF